MTTMWQQLGSFVENVGNCTDYYLEGFKECGGKVLFIKMYDQNENDPVADANYHVCRDGWLDHIKTFGLRAALWSNFRDIYNINGYTSRNNQIFREPFGDVRLIGMMLDIEAEAKADQPDTPGTPDERYQAMRKIMASQRALNPKAMIGVSSYGRAVETMDWRSVINYGARFCPQWYYAYDGKFDPQYSVWDWKRQNLGPVSFIHGCLSVVEGHDLSYGVERVRSAHFAEGYTTGFQTYTLENHNDQHFAVLARAKAQGLFLP